MPAELMIVICNRSAGIFDFPNVTVVYVVHFLIRFANDMLLKLNLNCAILIKCVIKFIHNYSTYFKTRSKAYEFDPIKLNNISVVTLSVWFLAGCSTSTS